MRTVSLAAVQFSCGWDRGDNVAKADRLVRQAAGQGAQVVLLPELFETPYFCAVQNSNFYALARPLADHPTVGHFRRLAADGRIAGHYRKSHIPQAPGYEEKFYFSPGDTGFAPVDTAYGRLGIAICWDTWFPEAARSVVLQGAEFLMYPTAIGSEPNDSTVDSMEHWRIVMRGHAGANMVPVVAANRIGVEMTDHVTMTFYGSSFITDHLGALHAIADRTSEQVLVQSFDLDRCFDYRQSWGCFRDRRPDLYGSLCTLDGEKRTAGARQC
jgi:N-carbamoylputrescine amidase